MHFYFRYFPSLQDALLASPKELLQYEGRRLAYSDAPRYPSRHNPAIRGWPNGACHISLLTPSAIWAHTLGRPMHPQSHAIRTGTKQILRLNSPHMGKKGCATSSPPNDCLFCKYVLARTIDHMVSGFAQSDPPAAILGRYADLWLTLRLDRSCTYTTKHCAALRCFSLA